MKVLVAGGTGNVGSAVVNALAVAGSVDIKVLTRDPASQKALRLATLPNVTLVEGDYADADSLSSILEGVDASFLGCSNFVGQVAAEKAFIDAAAATGSCKYLIKLGTCGADGYTGAESEVEHGRYHQEIEDHLAKSSLAWTVLRPNCFMSNHMGDIFGTLPMGIIAYPSPPSARATLVDTRDVGDIAARLLLLEDPSVHAGQKYDVCGPSAVSFEEMAAMYTAALGRPIAAVSPSKEEWAVNAEKAGFEPWLAKGVSLTFGVFWASGKLDYPSSDAVLTLCKPMRTMEAWVTEHAPLSPPPK